MSNTNKTAEEYIKDAFDPVKRIEDLTELRDRFKKRSKVLAEMADDVDKNILILTKKELLCPLP